MPARGPFTAISAFAGGPLGFGADGEAANVQGAIGSDAPVTAAIRPVGSSSSGPVQTIGTGRDPELSVTDSGAALAAWEDQGDGKLELFERVSGGCFGTAR